MGSTAQNTAAGDKATRTRAASPFKATVKATIAVHNESDADATVAAIGQVLSDHFGTGYAVRTVSRSRATKSGKPSAGPASLMVYIAPTGYEFPKAGERGVRLDADTANLLRGIASRMGLDPNDPASIVAVAKALAAKAQ